jgi:hypothetical protein
MRSRVLLPPLRNITAPSLELKLKAFFIRTLKPNCLTQQPMHFKRDCGSGDSYTEKKKEYKGKAISNRKLVGKTDQKKPNPCFMCKKRPAQRL